MACLLGMSGPHSFRSMACGTSLRGIYSPGHPLHLVSCGLASSTANAWDAIDYNNKFTKERLKVGNQSHYTTHDEKEVA